MATDSILYLGAQPSAAPRGADRPAELAQFLSRLGYAVRSSEPGQLLAEPLGAGAVDLVVLDGRLAHDGVDLCAFLRGHELTRTIPIVYLAPPEAGELAELNDFERVEVVHAPFSVGALASRIAMQLRLRKMAGQDELKSTIAEMNAALRDLNARFRRELEEARAIQQSLLPAMVPAAPGMELAISYQPLEELGGDWYYTEQDGSGRIKIQIADVTGHGLSAALIASMVKLALVAVGEERPDALLTGMNRLLTPQLPSGRFVTMAGYLYDPQSGRLRWSRAGHPPGLWLRRKQQRVEHLMGSGFALGFVDDARFELLEDTLEPGDVVLLFTDGLSEAHNRAREVLGFERLAAALRATEPHWSSAQILTAVLDAFDHFRQERLVKDDVTVIVLKRV